ncbi:MAG: nucleotide exchange factor GrpE [bacterium]
MSNTKVGPVKELLAKLDEVESSCSGYRDAALRASADFENFRRRASQEGAEARRRGIEAVVGDVIPVLDNFERALAASMSEATVESVHRGLVMIQRQLRSALEAHGLADFSCVGEPFDPRRAEAVGFVESDEHAPETVVGEECRGYRCGDRVIRPARVVVARPKTGSESNASGPGPGVSDRGSQDS